MYYFQFISEEGLRVIREIVRRETVDAPASRGSRIGDYVSDNYDHDIKFKMIITRNLIMESQAI